MSGSSSSSKREAECEGAGGVAGAASSSSSTGKRPLPGQEVEDIDLGAAMSPLSREALELLVVRLVATHPEFGDMILREVSKPVDYTAVHRAVVAALNSFTGELPVGELLGVLEEHVKRAGDYVKAKSYANAQAVLSSMTGPFVQWCSVNAASMDGEGERREVEEFFGRLEAAWEGALRGSERTLKREDAEKYFGELAGWRTSLQEAFGPIFSDPLRVLKRFIKAAGGGPPASKKARKE